MEKRIEKQKCIVWSHVNHEQHPHLQDCSKRNVILDFLYPLFPGISYRVLPETVDTLEEMVIHALIVQYKHLSGIPWNQISKEDMVTIHPFLPVEGEEWKDVDWQFRFFTGTGGSLI